MMTTLFSPNHFDVENWFLLMFFYHPPRLVLVCSSALSCLNGLSYDFPCCVLVLHWYGLGNLCFHVWMIFVTSSFVFTAYHNPLLRCVNCCTRFNTKSLMCCTPGVGMVTGSQGFVLPKLPFGIREYLKMREIWWSQKTDFELFLKDKYSKSLINSRQSSHHYLKYVCEPHKTLSQVYMFIHSFARRATHVITMGIIIS